MAENYFGESVAAHYDDDSSISAHAVIDPVVDRLVEFSGAGEALEFGIGTGRIALPLTQRGVTVRGIDLSEAMVRRLEAKPGGDAIEVAIGDFATTVVPGSFSLVYLIFNTIFNLTSQDEQVSCFQNAAAHLEPGGRFLIETGVPRVQKLAPGERFLPFDLGENHWGVDEYDVVTQNFKSHHVFFGEGGVRRASTPFRYAWPAELDLMARLAGLRLKARWGGWGGEPFTESSPSHVSVWEKPEGCPDPSD